MSSSPSIFSIEKKSYRCYKVEDLNNGIDYIVFLDSRNNWRCTCKYHIRSMKRQCKHIKEVIRNKHIKEVIRNINRRNI